MLQKTSISVPLGAGLDTKTSDALIMPARLSRLENAVFPKQGELQKRPGFERLPATGVPKGEALTRFDQELLVAGGFALSAYTPESAAWRSRGSLRSIGVRATNVWADHTEQRFPSSGTLNDVTLVAYESSDGGIYATVFDERSGGRVVSNVRAAAAGAKPMVIACGNFLYLFFLTDKGGGTFAITYSRLSTASPSTFLTPVDLIAAANVSATKPYFVVKAFAGAMTLAYVNNLNDLILAWVTPDGQLGSFANGYIDPVTVATTQNTISCLNLATYNDKNIFVLWAMGTQLRAAAYDQVFNATRATADIGAAQAHSIVNVTGCQAFPNAGAYAGIQCWFEVAPATGAPASNTVVRFLRIPADNSAAGALADFIRSVGLGCDAFLDTSGAHVGVVYDSTYQSTFFVSNTAKQMVSKALATRAGGLTGYPRLPTVAQPAANRWAVTVGSKGRLVAQSGEVTFFTKTITRLDLDFGNERYRSAQLGRNLHLAGGVVSAYDGAQLFEAGFHVYPEAAATAGQEWVFTTKNGTPGNPIAINIVPPPDVVDSVPVVHSGARVRPGSYIILHANDVGARNYYWFTVDGQGADPLPFGAFDVTGIRCDLLSTDSQNLVAQKLSAAIRSTAFAGSTLLWTSSVSPDNTVVAGPSGAVVIGGDYTWLPAAEGTFMVQAYHYGDAATPERFVVVCPAGKWISGGQWFFAESSRRDAGITTNSMRAYYFVVDGVGTAPTAQDLIQPGVDVAVTIPIAINSTDTMQQVAVAVRNAINGTQRSALPLLSAALLANSCEVTVACVANTGGGFGVVSKHAYNYNAAAPLSAGERLYYLVYRWTDAQGQIHCSAPSPGVKAITGAAGGTNIVGATTYRLGRRAAGSIFIDVYRTPSEGELVPRLVKSLANDATVDAVSFLDDVSDSDLQSAELAYWSGGELENIARLHLPSLGNTAAGCSSSMSTGSSGTPRNSPTN
jgi:hypothetical protein